MKKISNYLFLFFIIACNNNQQTKKAEMNYKTTGTIERSDPSLDSIIDPTAQAEIIAEGFEWSEGPLWIEDHKMLLFSDVPKNIIYKWTAEKDKEISGLRLVK